MIECTERNMEVYQFIKHFQEDHGFSPSIREIGRGVYMSPACVYRHLGKLVSLGMISMEPKQPRTIVLKVIV